MLFRIGCDNMKIEKINDNQIRCTLTREDLENHQIRISELAYGTEKAKKTFPRYDAAGTDTVWF